jgi:acetyltransferase-like isoleucine patch superfamily enzyme
MNASSSSSEINELMQMLAMPDQQDLDRFNLLLQQISPAEVRAGWSAVRRTKMHDGLFELVRQHLWNTQPRFGGFTCDLLQIPAATYGWSIGDKTYGNPRILEAGRGKLTIGRYCSLAEPTIILGNHNAGSISSYPFMDLWHEWPGTYVGLEDHIACDVIIGNDVWIGVHSTILPGTIIGDGAVIGAGSVVRGVISPYSICAGVPAIVKKMRFSNLTITRLLALKWWAWPDAMVDRYIPDLLAADIEGFLDKAERELSVS